MDSTESIIIIIKYFVLYWTPDFLGMILWGRIRSQSALVLIRKYRWSLNHPCLNCMGPLIPELFFFFQINTQFTLYPWVSHPWIQPTAVNWGSKFLSSVHWILWGKTWGYRGPALGVDDCEHWDFITSTGDPVAGLAISYSSLLSPNSSNYALKKKKNGALMATFSEF